MDTGLSLRMYLPGNGTAVHLSLKLPSTISDSDRTQLAQQIPALFSVLLGLTGEKREHEQWRLCLQALRSASENLFPGSSVTPVHTHYSPYGTYLSVEATLMTCPPGSNTRPPQPIESSSSAQPSLM